MPCVFKVKVTSTGTRAHLFNEIIAASQKSASIRALAAASSSSSENSEAEDTFSETFSWDDEVYAHMLASESLDLTEDDRPFITVEKRKSGSASEGGKAKRKQSTASHWSDRSTPTERFTPNAKCSGHASDRSTPKQTDPRPSISGHASDRPKQTADRSTPKQTADRSTPKQFADRSTPKQRITPIKQIPLDGATPNRFDRMTPSSVGRFTPTDRLTTPVSKFSPATTPLLNQTPDLFGSPDTFTPIKLVKPVSLEAAWNRAQRIPGLNPRLFRLDSDGMLIMSPKYNRQTNLDYKAVSEERIYSYARIRYQPDDAKQHRTLNLIQVALLGYINNNDDEDGSSADITCWVPSEIHYALWRGNRTALYWYKGFYLNPNAAAGQMPHGALFDELGICLQKPRLTSVDGNGALEDNLVFTKGPSIPTCTDLKILEK